MFESIAQAISPEKPKPHMAVRTSVISHMKRHADHYKCWWDGLNPDGKAGTTWDDYTSKVSKNLAWAGSLELAAAAAHYDRPIQVLGPHMMHSEVYNRNSKKNTIFLWYTTDPGHYGWLSGTPPAELQSCEVRNGPLQGGRGGSQAGSNGTRLSALPLRLDESSCANTRVSALPALNKQSAPRTRSSALPHVPQSAVSSLGASHGTSDLDGMIDDSCGLAPQPKTKTQSAAAMTKGPREVWKCPYCEWSTKTKHVYAEKKAHLDAWHPSLKAQASLQKTIVLTKVAAKDAYWKCPKCDLGISEELRQSCSGIPGLRSAILRHKKDKHPRASDRCFNFRSNAKCFAARQRTHAAVRNKAAAGRIAKSQGCVHQISFLWWPKWWKVRPNRHDVICLKCKRLQKSVDALEKEPCDFRASFVGRRKAFLDKSFCRATKDFCVKCKRICAQYKDFDQVPCVEKPLPAHMRKRTMTCIWSLAGKSRKRRAEAQILVDQLNAENEVQDFAPNDGR